ncbi:MAG: hypothetical protein A3H96_14445 [Acidobacteria bacterium RIFCSPLOWO2_02_FULL_67_36]|nr:MAG: hypothetical protein A3H96_14445 [Acidobacteria bacterium RIFCSPLOWO2_02_FULL_67_36]OFW18427.1 MAG: hypothetical protein A3G21_07955 [Acidobacteria bacterium RIFCSPLOWO2_12_FULL_66_21]
MDCGFRSPLIDFFRRGEVARDVRLLAAQGALAPRAHEQLALLILLSDDPDPLIAVSASATLDSLPVEPLRAFLARSDVPAEMRAFFAARGVTASATPAGDADLPLVDADQAPEPEEEDDGKADPQILSSLPIIERMKLAMKGTRAQRAQLIRDSNKLVAAAVLSSPKLTEVEVESFARMANVSEETLRTIATNRSWVKNYGVVAGLTKNPKTPVALAMRFLQRLNERDLKTLSIDRNVPEPVRIAARKYILKQL